MFEGSTDFLSYALVLFLGWVYLPYTFFKFSAEIFIDLGRRRDATQLEEIISAFLPSVVLNVQAIVIFKVCSLFESTRFSIDFAVMAAMFGDSRGAVSVSDYIYAGNWWGPVLYLGFLWILAVAHGFFFGKTTAAISDKQEIALQGIDRVDLGKVPPEIHFIAKYCWFTWFSFFRESFVPLYTWRQKKPVICVETKDGRFYVGRIVGYEKTTDGKIEAIRLENADRLQPPRANEPGNYRDTRQLLVIWTDIVEMRLMEMIEEAEKRTSEPQADPQINIRNPPRPPQPEAP